MAFGTTSKVMAYAVLQMGKQAAQKLTADVYNAALFGNTVTPDNTVSTAALSSYKGAGSTWSLAHEVATGGGYTQGGKKVTPQSWAQSGNVLKFSSSGAPQWTAATFSTYGLAVYDKTHATQLLCYNAFGGIQTVTAGTFTVTWNTTGIAKFTC